MQQQFVVIYACVYSLLVYSRRTQSSNSNGEINRPQNCSTKILPDLLNEHGISVTEVIVSYLNRIEIRQEQLDKRIEQLHQKWESEISLLILNLKDTILTMASTANSRETTLDSVNRESETTISNEIEIDRNLESETKQETNANKEKNNFQLCSVSSESVYEFATCIIRNDQVWTLIQQRTDLECATGNCMNFNRSWEEYASGFGDTNTSFWAGNEYLHYVSNKNQQLLLRIELEDFENNAVWAEYDKFVISSKDDNYRLLVGNFNGTASDSLTFHNYMPFSAFDRKNDEAPNCCPCAVTFGSGWWFKDCFESNLNGIYQPPFVNNNEDYYKGIIWDGWLGNYSLRRVRIMLRKY